MALDYVSLGRTADTILRQVGMSVSVFRDEVKVASGFGVFVSSNAQNETQSSSSYLAQTTTTDRTLLLTGLAKEPLVNDSLLADKVTYLVKGVEKVRPTTTTLLYKLMVS